MKNIQTFERYQIQKGNKHYETIDFNIGKKDSESFKIPASIEGILLDNRHITWEQLSNFLKKAIDKDYISLKELEKFIKQNKPE
jgi:hypothetical protein